MKMKIIYICILLLIVIFGTACIGFDKAVVTFSINEDGSGSGKAIFQNIYSIEDYYKDVRLTDFASLIDEYLNDNGFEYDFPGYNIQEKKLFEKNNQLWGQLDFSFEHYSDINIWKYEKCDCCPWILYIDPYTMEVISNSNGEIEVDEDDEVSKIIWDSETNEFQFTVELSEYYYDDYDIHPLLQIWQMWKKDIKKD